MPRKAFASYKGLQRECRRVFKGKKAKIRACLKKARALKPLFKR